jgi:inosine/xanthosine triphosphatase
MKVRIAIGSLNPTKIEGVKKAFAQYFDVDVDSKNVESGVGGQPFNADVVKGAINRAINAYSTDYDFSVGIEAGLFSLKNTLTGYLDFQVAAIYNGFKLTLGFGPGFEYPSVIIEEVLKGREVGDVMERLTGIERLGEKVGAIHYLTKGVVSRSELTRMAVTMALIPWINSELYEL